MAREAPVRQIRYKPMMTDEMIDAATRVLRSGKYIRSFPLEDSEGKRFEDEFCAYIGAPHAVKYGTPIHLDHAYQPYCGAPEGTFPVTERLAQTILTLPCYQTLDADDIGYTAEAIRQFYRE